MGTNNHIELTEKEVKRMSNNIVAKDNKTMNAEIKEARLESRAGKYLTFFLESEEYGVEILKVQEIIGRMPITSVPRTPNYIRGVINLRGKIHPIMDLKVKFSMEHTQITDETCIIVIKTSTIMMGILVDRVSEVANIVSGEIEDTPSFGAGIDTDYLLGVGKTGGKVRLLLDIEKVITAKDVIQLKKAANSGDTEVQEAAAVPVPETITENKKYGGEHA